MEILDPDGWRADGKPFTDPIPLKEFATRAWICTMRVSTEDWDRLVTDANAAVDVRH